MMALLARLWNSPTFTTWGSLGIRLSAVLLILPTVLVRFPAAEIAVWQLFSMLFSFALMLDFGLAPTFSRMLAFARGGAQLADMAQIRETPARHNRAEDKNRVLTRLLGSQRWLYPRLAAGVTFFSAIAGTTALIVPISQLQKPTHGWIAWVLVLFSTAIGLWGAGYAAALQGMDRIAVMRRWEVLTGLGQIISSISVLWIGGELLALVASYQVWIAINALRNRWLLLRLHPELLSQKATKDPSVLHVMWPAAWRSGLGTVMSQGLIAISGLLYSQTAKAAEVAAYLLALRIIQMISQFCQAPYYTKLPYLASLIAAGKLTEMLEVANRGMRLAYWVFVAGVLVATYGAPPTLSLIGSKTNFVSQEVWLFIALAFFVERFGAMHMQLYSLSNHIVWHIANGWTGAIMIIAATLLYPWAGIISLPIAMLVAYATFYTPYAAFHSTRKFNFQLISFERKSAAPAFATLLIGLLFAYASQKHGAQQI